MIVQTLIIGAFAAVGFWLESIGCKDGFIDELLTPVPLSFVGIIYVIGFAQ
jgi:hypothetical protein